MIAFLFLLCFLVCYGIVFKNNPDYLDITQTNAVKGVFIIIVFLNHARSYLTLSSNMFNNIYAFFFRVIGQMMVVMFLFYSGYGVGYQLQIKGKAYERVFIKKRIISTWFHFALAVAFYAIINIVLQRSYSSIKWIGCWFGWESIGNSNWFVFDILILYIITFVSIKISNSTNVNRSKERIQVYSITVMTLLLWLLLYLAKRPDRYWYNTLIAYPFGMWYCYNRKTIESVFAKKEVYCIVLLLSGIFFSLLTLVRNSIGENIAAILFSTIVIMITMKVHIGNRALNWLGIHLFPIFILQRIPMIILSDYEINPVLFVLVCFIITIVLTYLYEAVIKKADSFLKLS